MSSTGGSGAMKSKEEMDRNKEGGNGQPKAKKKRGCQQCDKLIGLLQQLKGHMEGLKVKADQLDEFREKLSTSECELETAHAEIKKLRRQLALASPSEEARTANAPEAAPAAATPAAKLSLSSSRPRVANPEASSPATALRSSRDGAVMPIVAKFRRIRDSALASRGQDVSGDSDGGHRGGEKVKDASLGRSGRGVAREGRPGGIASVDAGRQKEGDVDGGDADDKAHEVDSLGKTDRSSTSGHETGSKPTRGDSKSERRSEEPTGVFAATAFSFLEGSDAEGEEGNDMEDSMGFEESEAGGPEKKRSRALGSSNGGKGRRHSQYHTIKDSQKARKRPRTFGEPSPRSSSKPSSVMAVMKGNQQRRRGDDGAWYDGDGSEEEDGLTVTEEDLETYEEISQEMAGLGWSDAWRRAEACLRAGIGEVGDGLDEASRRLARKHLDMVRVDDPRTPMGHKQLSELLRLELAGKANMEGILMAVLRGRSVKRDAGFLGKLALRLVEGIDAAHASSPSEPEILSLVVEELEGVAGVLVAPSTPELKRLGWGRETRLAVEFLWKILEDWMDEAAQSAASSREDGDIADGFLSMSFGRSKRKKGKASKAKAAKGSSSGKGDDGKRSGFAWTAEAEAPLLYWWETDETSRVPWGVARLLGLVLRQQMGQQERARGILHSILVRALSGPSRLLRFPLAFLEAFPGFLASSSPMDAFPGVDSDADAGLGAAEGRGQLLLTPGLWRRAALAALFPGGRVVADGGGAALVSARLKNVCLYGGGGRDDTHRAWDGDAETSTSAGGDDSRGEATRLAEGVLEAIGGLHSGDSVSCPLCYGGDGGGGDGYGGDDALAVSSWNGGSISGAGAGTDNFPEFDDLFIPRCRGELIAVEVVRALRLLSLGLEEPWQRFGGGFPIEKRLDSVISRGNICGRVASLACHVLAQCAGATFPKHPRSRASASDGMARRVCKTLLEVMHSDPTKWEVGQLRGCFKLSIGAKAQAAVALLSLLRGLQGEIAAGDELYVVSWVQDLEARKRLLLPLPLLSAIASTLSRPPAHVINLSRRSDRWSIAIDIAKREGIWLHRHKAIDGVAVDGSTRRRISDRQVTFTWDSELNTMHDPNCEQGKTIDLTPSERACAASHAILWQQHKDGLLAPFMPEVHPDAVLILEDDAQLTPGFLERAKAAMLLATASDANTLTKKTFGAAKKWDVLYLGHILPKQIMIGIANAEAKAEKQQLLESTREASLEATASENARENACENAGEDRYDDKSLSQTPSGTGESGPGTTAAPPEVSSAAGSLKVVTVKYAWCLHAYLLTREGAKQLVSRMPVSAPADIFVASFLTGTDNGRPLLAGRAVLPAIAKASPGNGDVKSLVALRAGGATEDMVRSLTGIRKAFGKKGSRGMKGGGGRKSAIGSDGDKAKSSNTDN